MLPPEGDDEDLSYDAMKMKSEELPPTQLQPPPQYSKFVLNLLHQEYQQKMYIREMQIRIALSKINKKILMTGVQTMNYFSELPDPLSLLTTLKKQPVPIEP